MKVVLVEPMIPQNTGSIGRLCAANDTPLILVKPLGFSLESKWVKRAGLDYWPWIDLTVVDNFKEALDLGATPWLFTSEATQSFTDVTYEPDDLLVFGCETTGLSQEILEMFPKHQVALPMPNHNVRSLNLAQTAAVGLYEARRQIGQTAIHVHKST